MGCFDMDVPDNSTRRFLAPLEFARLSGLSLATVHRYLRSGKLPFFQPNGRRGRILIPIDALKSCNANEKGDHRANEAATEVPDLDAQKLSGPRPKWAR
jgi:hypothetical protein